MSIAIPGGRCDHEPLGLRRTIPISQVFGPIASQLWVFAEGAHRFDLGSYDPRLNRCFCVTAGGMLAPTQRLYT
jgi:hypothetical protein